MWCRALYIQGGLKGFGFTSSVELVEQLYSCWVCVCNNTRNNASTGIRTAVSFSWRPPFCLSQPMGSTWRGDASRDDDGARECHRSGKGARGIIEVHPSSTRCTASATLGVGGRVLRAVVRRVFHIAALESLPSAVVARPRPCAVRQSMRTPGGPLPGRARYSSRRLSPDVGQVWQ